MVCAWPPATGRVSAACSLVHSAPKDPECAWSGTLLVTRRIRSRFTPTRSMLRALCRSEKALSIVPITFADFGQSIESTLTEEVGPCRSLRQASNWGGSACADSLADLLPCAVMTGSTEGEPGCCPACNNNSGLVESGFYITAAFRTPSRSKTSHINISIESHPVNSISTTAILKSL